MPRSPKDTFITVYGRKPVLEALEDRSLRVDKVIVAEGLGGEPVRAIIAAARGRQVPVQRASAHRVKVLAGNGRHDQGVLADVVAPRMAPVEEFLDGIGDGPGAVLVLDRVTNPANVGMLLRSATAAGLDGVLLPRRGVPAIDPLVVKASAGVAFRAPVLRARHRGRGVRDAARGRVRGLRAGRRGRVAAGCGAAAAGRAGARQRDRRPVRRRHGRAGRDAGDPHARRGGVAQRGQRRGRRLVRTARRRTPAGASARLRVLNTPALFSLLGGMVPAGCPVPRSWLRCCGPRRSCATPADRRLQRAASITDLRAIARRRTPRAVFDYTDGAADGELSLGRARAAFARVEFHPSVLRDVSEVDTGRDMLGQRSALPFAFAPTGFTRMMHTEGEPAVVSVAEQIGIPYTLSTMGTTTIEDVAAAAPGARRWFQLYLWRDRAPAKDLVQRAAEAGYDTLMLTVDTPVGAPGCGMCATG